MKALVTGGLGFLGRYITQELIKEGIETVVYDCNSPSDEQMQEMNGLVTYVTGDILDLETLIHAMNNCDLVFHTAAIADIDQAKTMPVTTLEVNVIGTANCLEAARIIGVKRFLFSSSVYTSGNRGSFYRVSKQAGESLCKTYAEEYGLKYSILKYGSLYGRDANHWNFMYMVCHSLITKGEFTYSNSPEAMREYIHIFDAARETVRIATNPEYVNKAVLITGHQRMQMRELFETIQEILGYSVIIKYVPEAKYTHYIKTPYSFDLDLPIRINLSNYIDIHEGILDCLHDVKNQLQEEAINDE